MDSVSDRIAGVIAAALVGTALLATPLAASAQQSTAPAPSQAAPAPAPAAPSATAKKRAARADRVEAHIKSLHDQLKITPDQEQKWSDVAQAMRDNAHAIDQLATERAAKRSSMTAVDDLRSYEAIADAHAQEMKQLVPAFSALYDSMSDAQKKNADQVFARPQRARRTSSASHG
jgi:hypothetical protein